ncbi:MAG: ATP-binding protein [Planctomycetes bacterium]|nr:ATP-binding protein [Planctomycetota bacterium]
MSDTMPYYSRSSAATLRRALGSFPAVLVTGPRQTGKTTLLQQELAASHRYLSLERPDVRARVRADPVAFLAENPPPLILDEIQQVPELLSFVKERIDASRRPGSYVLSGSQSFALMQGVTQSLAGRIAVLTLLPLSVGEAIVAPTLSIDEQLRRVFEPGAASAVTSSGSPAPRAAAFAPPDALDWIVRGGYPEPRLNPAVDRALWFASYVQSYLERDVRDLLKVGDLHDFSRFLALIAAASGRLLNFSDLARELGVSAPTAKRWLSVLEASHVVTQLRPWHENFGKRLTKAPKLIFHDPGLAAWLLGLHQREALQAGPSFGALFETAVAGEWLKAFHHAGEPPALHHWRSSGGLEVDLVLERDGRLYAIETKATATPTPRHAEGLAKWLALAGPRARGVVACRVESPVTLAPGIRAVPWHLAW